MKNFPLVFLNDNSAWVGDTKNNQPNGPGWLIEPNGTKLKGHYENGEKNGVWAIIGSNFKGTCNFKNGIAHGEFVSYYEDKNVILIQKYEHGKHIESETFNLTKRKSSQIMSYNEGSPRVRAKDGLHIYPMICFNCKTFSEYASDPYNASGNSINGIEYFKSIKLNKKHISEALKYAKSLNNKILIQKINKL